MWRVLAVEEDVNVIAMTAESLRDLGYSVPTCRGLRDRQELGALAEVLGGSGEETLVTCAVGSA